MQDPHTKHLNGTKNKPIPILKKPSFFHRYEFNVFYARPLVFTLCSFPGFSTGGSYLYEYQGCYDDISGFDERDLDGLAVPGML